MSSTLKSGLPVLVTVVSLMATSPVGSGACPEDNYVTDSIISAGEFNTLDRSHWARGEVALILNAGGRFVIRLGDGFESASGPDLRVVVSQHPNPQRGSDLGDYIELDQLRQTRGAQDFLLPDATDRNTIGSVVIYCKRFDVLFSVATLQEPVG